MADFFKNTYLAGLGVVSLTYEKANNIAKDLVKKGELAKEKQKDFVDRLVNDFKENTSKLEKLVNEKIDYLAKKGQPLKDKQDALIEDISKRTKKISKEAEAKIRNTVKETLAKTEDIKKKVVKEKPTEEERIEEILKKYNIPSAKDIEELNKKLDKLLESQG